MIKAMSLVTSLCVVGLLTACAVSPETQALMDEYDRTIPSCSTSLECQTKWAAARSWAIANADFPIYTESDTRIRATSTLTTTSGIGVVVHREGSGNNYRFLVDVECFNAYGCPNIWQAKVDFNRTLNATGS
jgi:hypothetical protein